MAVTNLISYSLLDASGKRGNLLVYIPVGPTMTNIQDFSDAFVPLLDDVTSAKIESGTISFALTLPGGIKASADAGVFIQHGANYAFDAANTDYRHTLRVPAAALATLSGNTIITPENGNAVELFITQLISGSDSVYPTDRYANDLVAFLGGTKTFRRK